DSLRRGARRGRPRLHHPLRVRAPRRVLALGDRAPRDRLRRARRGDRGHPLHHDPSPRGARHRRRERALGLALGHLHRGDDDPGRVVEGSLIGVALILAAVIAGPWVVKSSIASWFTLSPNSLHLILPVYAF